MNDAASARAAVQHLSTRLRAAGIGSFRAPPPEPTTCCGRGCNGCVWEGYLDAVAWWRDDALALLPK
ncbi:oxidoreductase-like domain-containing protein [Variovorax sp. J2P1-59]|uniref:oxidoreductase-like domain-containing protein n=1 Tax=Variovorax flavidus TaxID=3053501 RepID=UPI00257604BF|nr:oxidoreductase-like domain-containing protein [Variovorax sp. J2P1-59]MDM0073924.1 oxidoreductase-like domain-containing protein [Variovorax sp. J2P1-59]